VPRCYSGEYGGPAGNRNRAPRGVPLRKRESGQTAPTDLRGATLCAWQSGRASAGRSRLSRGTRMPRAAGH
jgi:hypothetical protein